MTFYYETAPLPTRLAHLAHNLPEGWHHLESWLALVLELVIPFAIFGPRRVKLAAFAAFTGFQIVNAATANYGFFCYLACALHVFLLGDRDVARAQTWLAKQARQLRLRLQQRMRSRPAKAALRPRRSLRARARWLRIVIHRRRLLPRLPRGLRRAAALTFCAIYIGISTLEGLGRFGGQRGQELAASAADLRAIYAPLRLVSTYHLFAAITRERIEPEVQTTSDGLTWTAHDLRFKPGDPTRAPPFVAPHQPRLDFQLWFYGLSRRRGVPAYVQGLLDRVCHDPDAVAGFFAGPLPNRPASARIAFFRYRFTTPAERRATGAWWTREAAGATGPLACRPRG
jgi:hypothetical protein